MALPCDRETLYISSSGSIDETIQSQAALFMLRFSNSDSFDVVLVEPDTRKDETSVNADGASPRKDLEKFLINISENFHALSLDTAGDGMEIKPNPPPINGMVRSMKGQTTIPDIVRGCRLPVILNASRDVCHCGLSTVVRRIVSLSAKKGCKKMANLLGFRQTSLKNCAEASAWTKLVDTSLAEDLCQLFSRVGDQGENNSTEASNTIPESITLLERKLASPVSTFNIHRQQEVATGGRGKYQGDKRSSKRGESGGMNGVMSDYKTERIVINKKAYKDAIRAYKQAISKQEISPNTRFKDSEFFISLDSWRKKMKESETLAFQITEEKISGDSSSTNSETGVRLVKSEQTCDVTESIPAVKTNRSGEDGAQLRTNDSDSSRRIESCNHSENSYRTSNVEKGSCLISGEGNAQGSFAPSSPKFIDLLSGVTSNDEHHGERTKTGKDGNIHEARRSKTSSGIPIDVPVTFTNSLDTSGTSNPAAIQKSIPTESSLKHLFAEGPSMTITDLAIFFHVHLFFWMHKNRQELPAQIPHTVNWYKRMWSVVDVTETASSCGLEQVQLWQGAGVSTAEIKISPPVDYEFGKGKSRKARNHAIKRELPAVLSKLEDSVGLQSAEERHFTTLDWSALPAAVSPQHGEVPRERLVKKHQQIECLVSAVTDLAQDGDIIVDFCSGGGHVGIVLAYLLPECTIYMIENNEESLRRAHHRTRELQMSNVMFYQSNIGYFHKFFNIGVSLHACGVATDIVIDKCLRNNASFVSSPCCYGSINPSDHISYPRSRKFNSIPITLQEYLVVAHAAEQTNWDFTHENSKRGKLCMSIIDEDRSSYVREHGYQVHLCSLQPLSCSPKNNLLIAVAPEIPHSSLR